ncbi:mediator of RNA polymerase II transcription subunit 15a-like [Humulus lupulus]|uniref:mediator of RNA polymerase II transcription subunit 15a-like n=1 Tax=Humulus lupulus TaxID=3486 RepID=UPI002B41351B|nr:mediator of RNA polymerase II transcription subunit 15a-like [Humulus lupulus]
MVGRPVSTFGYPMLTLALDRTSTWFSSPKASVNSAATGHASGVDWQEEVYQKELYLPELHELYQKIAGKLQQRKLKNDARS